MSNTNYESQNINICTEINYVTNQINTSIPINNPSLLGFGINGGIEYEFCVGINVSSLISNITNLDYSSIISINLYVPGNINLGDYYVISHNQDFITLTGDSNVIYTIPILDKTDPNNVINFAFLENGVLNSLVKIRAVDPRFYTLLDISNAYYVITYKKLKEIIVITQPTRTSFLPIEEFDTSGLSVKKVYMDLSEENTNLEKLVIQKTFLPNSTSVLISYTEGLTTKTINQSITIVNSLNNVQYLGTSSANQFDVFVPTITSNSECPIIVTIHGGGWSTNSINGVAQYGKRTQYQNNKNFILGCGCIYISLEYRLLVLDDDNCTNCANSYKDMLKDIDDAIGFINSHYLHYTKTINNNNVIYLMGYSAGGHLALLYSYHTNLAYAISQNNTEQQSVVGVIAEDAPTFFINNCDETVMALCNITNVQSPENQEKLLAASPAHYADEFCIKTLLAYSDSFAYAFPCHGSMLYKKLYPEYANCVQCNMQPPQGVCHIQPSNGNNSILTIFHDKTHTEMGNTYAIYLDSDSYAEIFYETLEDFINE